MKNFSGVSSDLARTLLSGSSPPHKHEQGDKEAAAGPRSFLNDSTPASGRRGQRKTIAEIFCHKTLEARWAVDVVAVARADATDAGSGATFRRVGACGAEGHSVTDATLSGRCFNALESAGASSAGADAGKSAINVRTLPRLAFLIDFAIFAKFTRVDGNAASFAAAKTRRTRVRFVTRVGAKRVHGAFAFCAVPAHALFVHGAGDPQLPRKARIVVTEALGAPTASVAHKTFAAVIGGALTLTCAAHRFADCDATA